MTRLKLKIIQNFIRHMDLAEKNHGTSGAFSLLMVLSRYQDPNGYVPGVYYKEVCEEMHCSVQTYYHSRYILEQMGLIRCQKSHSLDCDITIIGNDFPYSDNRNPKKKKNDSYINTNQCVFHSDDFRKLKVQEMCLLCLFMAYTDSAGRKGAALYYRDLAEFYQEYTTLFGCTEKTLRGYLHTLKKFFPIKSRKHQTKSGKKYMLFVNSIKPAYKELKGKSEETIYTERTVKVVIRREKIQSPDEDAIKDTAVLMRQYKKVLGGLEAGVKAVLSILKERIGRLHQTLEPALVHRLLRDTYPAIKEAYPSYKEFEQYNVDDLTDIF